MASSHRRRLLGAGSVGIAAALLLAACGSSSNSAPSSSAASPTEAASSSAPPAVSGELTIWTEDYYVKIFEPLVKTWADKNGLKITWVTKDFGKMTDEFIAAVPAGKGPDIFIAPTGTNKFVSNGVVAPVELGDAAAGFNPVSIEAVTKDGKIYGVPFTVENIALYRNTDLAPTAPATFDDMIKTGDALVKSGKAEQAFGIGQDPKSGNPYLLMPFQSSFGSQIFAKDASGNYDPNQLIIDDAKGVAFAEWLAKSGKSGALSPDLTLDIALQSFKDGKSPFLVTGPWDLAGVKDSKVKYAIDPIPSAGGETAAPFVGFYGVYASSQSKNPLAASLFLTDFMTSVDTQVGIWNSAKNPPALTAALEQVSSDPDMKAFGAIGATAVPIPPIPAMDQVWGPWGETQVLLQRGQGGDPAKLWKAMADKIRAAIAKG
jgi:arabinogalactan oligomer/maltooligosaccharide transport system substrate-binding protein